LRVFGGEEGVDDLGEVVVVTGGRGVKDGSQLLPEQRAGYLASVLKTDAAPCATEALQTGRRGLGYARRSSWVGGYGWHGEYSLQTGRQVGPGAGARPSRRAG
jgi:hypothetical protein